MDEYADSLNASIALRNAAIAITNAITAKKNWTDIGEALDLADHQLGKLKALRRLSARVVASEWNPE